MPSSTSAHAHTSTPTRAHQSTRAQTPIANCIQEEHRPEPKPPIYRPLVEQEREERQAHGITPADYGGRWRAAFRVWTGDAPLCGPGDRDKARAYWERLREAIKMGGWTPGEWNQLRRAEAVWGRRAQGHDPKFEAMGTRPGRPTYEDRERIRMFDGLLRMSWVVRGMGGQL